MIRAEHLAELAYPLLKHQLPQVPQRLQVAGDAKTETSQSLNQITITGRIQSRGALWASTAASTPASFPPWLQRLHGLQSGPHSPF